MKKIKVLWGMIFVLILLQVITVSYILNEFAMKSSKSNTRVAAEINQETITMDELVDRLLKDYGQDVLEGMINRKIVFSEAEKLGIEITNDEIERELEYLQKDYGSKEEFLQMLQEQAGISEEELYTEIRYSLLLDEMATRDVVISEEEMRTYYEQNLDLFYLPARYHLHQIVVRTEEEAHEAIREIEDGSSFEAVAAERSVDLITATDGGDMGIVSSNDFFVPREVDVVAEEIELDKLSEPIPVNDGFVVIKVSSRIAGGQQSFEDVQAKIRRELALQQVDGIHVFLEALRESAGVKKFLDAKQ